MEERSGVGLDGVELACFASVGVGLFSSLTICFVSVNHLTILQDYHNVIVLQDGVVDRNIVSRIAPQSESVG